MNESWDNPPRDPDAMNSPSDAPLGVPSRSPDPMTPALTPGALQATHVTCPNCGYNLTGVAIGGTCPECNLIIGRGTIQNPNLPTSGNAVAALVLGICSIVIGCPSYGLVALICGPLAIIYAGKARKQIAHGQVSSGSDGLATAGKITGIIGLCLGLLGLLFFVLVLILPFVVALLNQ